MITIGRSAFKPYFRPASENGATAISSSDQASPLSILTDLLAGGMAVPFELQAAMATATANLQRMPIVHGSAYGTLCCTTTSGPSTEVAVGKAKRKRTTFTAAQAGYLEKEYDSDQYMPRSRRISVAESLHLSENQIKTWFQNRRAKDKKIRSMTTLCSSSAELLPSSSSPILSPVPSAASSSSSSPSLPAPIQPHPQADPIPPLIEMLALGKSELIPISHLMSAFNPAQPPSQKGE